MGEKKPSLINSDITCDNIHDSNLTTGWILIWQRPSKETLIPSNLTAGHSVIDHNRINMPPSVCYYKPQWMSHTTYTVFESLTLKVGSVVRKFRGIHYCFSFAWCGVAETDALNCERSSQKASNNLLPDPIKTATQPKITNLPGLILDQSDFCLPRQHCSLFESRRKHTIVHLKYRIVALLYYSILYCVVFLLFVVELHFPLNDLRSLTESRGEWAF